MIPVISAGEGAMLERWRHQYEGKEIDIFQEFKVLTSEVISRTAFGSSYLHFFYMLMRVILFYYY
jgi:PHYB activation tagged suppressor 1